VQQLLQRIILMLLNSTKADAAFPMALLVHAMKQLEKQQQQQQQQARLLPASVVEEGGGEGEGSEGSRVVCSMPLGV